VDTVMVDGRVLMRGKRLLTLNESEIMKSANDHAAELLERSGVRVGPKWPFS